MIKLEEGNSELFTRFYSMNRLFIFQAKLSGKEVAVKKMLVQFNDEKVLIFLIFLTF